MTYDNYYHILYYIIYYYIYIRKNCSIFLKNIIKID
jgi:hypothetical protein